MILSQIHEMDLIYWFFGLPRSIVTCGGQLSGLEIDVEDTASSLMRGGSENQPFPILLHQDYLQRPPVRCCKVVGDAGYAEIDLLANRLKVHDAQGELTEESDFQGFARNDMFLEQARHFLDCVLGKSQPAVSLHDGVQSLRLALAARRSLEEGREVQLSEVNVHG
ncbi:Gfo/Idh/MocA family oxidoreductase [Pseudomonas sp. REB1044]|uniref:Gfo/Idh/MocA family oxidoreductase n=1 Tax=Pseudomonas sp. REB1044 TaxID=2675224 RepID=UPI00315D6442